MKKALVILMALAMTYAAFADVPVLNAAVTIFDGSAEIDYIIDLDGETTGMKNATSIDFDFTFWNGGSQATEGDGLWGELAISTDDVTTAAPDSAIDVDSDNNLALPSASVSLTDAAGFTQNLGLTDLFDANISFADNGEKAADAGEHAADIGGADLTGAITFSATIHF